MQTKPILQQRLAPARAKATADRRRRPRPARIVLAVCVVMAALPCVDQAGAGNLDDDVQTFAIDSVSRQNALALRLATGQTDNLKSHLEGLRDDACGPVAVRLSLGQRGGTEAWEKLLDDADDAATSKTLETAKTTDLCPNAVRAWTGGSLTLANDAPDASGRDFERVESNLSAGLDARLDADLALGLAIGGSNGDTIESKGTTRGKAALVSVAVYGSYHPGELAFAEAAAGLAHLNLSDGVFGKDGDLSGEVDHGGYSGFATVSVGRVARLGAVSLSPYLKASGQVVQLEAARQHIGSNAYMSDDQLSSSLAGTIGVDASMALRRLPDWIAVTPKAGIEVGYSLSHQSATQMAATGSELAGAVPGSTTTNETLRLEIGTHVKLFDELSLDLDLESQPIADGHPKTLRLSSSWTF